jgi:hypothetical protein
MMGSVTGNAPDHFSPSRGRDGFVEERRRLSLIAFGGPQANARLSPGSGVLPIGWQAVGPPGGTS